MHLPLNFDAKIFVRFFQNHDMDCCYRAENLVTKARDNL